MVRQPACADEVTQDVEDARRELQEAVRLDPQDADSLAHLAYCELKLGRVAEARPHLAAALRLDPSCADAGAPVTNRAASARLEANRCVHRMRRILP